MDCYDVCLMSIVVKCYCYSTGGYVQVTGCADAAECRHAGRRALSFNQFTLARLT